MDVNKVLAAFCDMANISESEKSKYLYMANIAVNQVQARCKKDTNEKDIAVLTMLCAAMVNLWTSLSKSNSDPTGRFSGNGYSISKDSKKQIEIANCLFDRWRVEAAHLLVDEGFAFFSSKEVLNNGCKK